MTHKTLVIDLDRCIGCYACEVACKNENSIPLGVHYNKVLTIGPLGAHLLRLHPPPKAWL